MESDEYIILIADDDDIQFFEEALQELNKKLLWSRSEMALT
jgi:hypothetical protein